MKRVWRVVALASVPFLSGSSCELDTEDRDDAAYPSRRAEEDAWRARDRGRGDERGPTSVDAQRDDRARLEEDIEREAPGE